MNEIMELHIPKLGFGLMRLPMTGERIDLEETKKMVDRFMEEGFCYFDTAYVYNNGESEEAARKALVERYPREKFYLATKLPAWAGAKTKEEAEQMFYTSLKRTGAGYFDFYLLHNLGDARTKIFDKFQLWDFLQERKKEGLIKHLGFSLHDRAEVLDEILTAHPEMDFVQLQINYADWESPSIESRKCYEVARKHGKPIIVMEPFIGGNLATPPEVVTEVLKKADPAASPSSWAVRFAASLEGVVTVLSGMSNLEQMNENLSYMKDFKPLTEKEQETVKEARQVLETVDSIPCTSCAYCMKDCPQNIAIFGTFQAMNMVKLYKNPSGAKRTYFFSTTGVGRNKASECINCGKCEEVCPQHIAIREELKSAAETLEA